MSSERITRRTLDGYLREVAKEIRREYGKQADVEMILVGGAAILASCHFRESTMDIDALIFSRSSLKDIFNRIGDRHGLPNGWLNQDFAHTASYSPKLREYSRYYRSYYGVLQVRTMSPAYMVAMKIAAFRPYKNDRSDIAGILSEYPMPEAEIAEAFSNLYPGRSVSEQTKQYVRDCARGKIDYKAAQAQEYENKVILQQFESEYEHVLKADNLDVILAALKGKKKT